MHWSGAISDACLWIWNEFNVSCLSKIKKKNLSVFKDVGFDDVTGYPGAVLSVIGKAVMVPAIQTWGCPSRHERMGVMSLLTLELRYHSAVMQVSVSEMQGIVGTYLSDSGYLSIRGKPGR